MSIEDVNNYLERIPGQAIYPETSSRITVVFNPAAIDGYIKRPKLTNFKAEDAGLLHQLLLKEADAFELLRQHPHPNLVRYHGCLVKRGRIMGLVLHRCSTTLEKRMKEGDITHFNKESWAKHLHTLGLAHNDLNPANIMLDEHDNATVIDLGSCKRFGEQLLTASTDGWVDEYFSTSEQRHDEAALKKIQAWLESDGRSRGSIA